MNLVLVGWLFLCLESATTTATQCLSCAPKPSTIQCVTTQTCQNGQECYAKYVLKPDGTVIYEFGCHYRQTCPDQLNTLAFIGRRATGDIELCYKCCHGDMCNHGTPCTATTTSANPCSPSPCVRGSCYKGSGNNPTFFCMCPSGFSGMYCETEINPCSPSPCVRGSCFIGSGNNPTFFCLCPSDFTGLHCETVISTTSAKTTPIQTTTLTVPTTSANPCSPSPCVRGSCFIGSENNLTFFCMCPSGFTGTYCGTEINPCVPSPCVRGSCFIGSESNSTFFCLCPSDYTGHDCETVISTTSAKTTPIQSTSFTVPTTSANPCFPSPCVRGSCYKGSGNNPTFFCTCPSGFSGVYCETEINPCSPSPCVRGSCFIGSENNPTFFCLCPSDFTGLHCETVSVISTTSAKTTPIQTTTLTVQTTSANPCFPSPCVRGSCYKGSGNNPTFFCLCPSDFTGRHCETFISTITATTCPIQTTTTTIATPTPVNPCSPNPCVRGSCDIGSGNNPTFLCMCPSGFTGMYCETIITTTLSTTTHTTPTTTLVTTTASTMRTTSPPTSDDCRDRLDDCYKYDPNVCTNTTYRAFMAANCPKYCGICKPAHPDPINCTDTLPNCEEYDSGDLCTSYFYHQWAWKNCRVYCQLDGCLSADNPGRLHGRAAKL